MPAKRHQPAFTLLEMLLAVSVLASMSVLIGAVWAQMRDWTTEGARLNASMRLPRVLEVMNAQWADRRASIATGDQGASLDLQPNSINFVCADPLLFPGWPLVVVTYEIETVPPRLPGGAPEFRLVCFERKLTTLLAEVDSAGEPETPIPAPPGLVLEEQIVLLDRCEELSFERYGQAANVGPRSSNRRDPAGMAVRADEPTDDDLLRRWRPMEPGYKGPINGLRLTGTFLGEPFTWVFDAEDLL